MSVLLFLVKINFKSKLINKHKFIYLQNSIWPTFSNRFAMSQSTCYYHYHFQEKQGILSFIIKECNQLCMVATVKSICFKRFNNSLHLQVWMMHINCLLCLLISVTSYHSLIRFNIFWWDIPYILLTVIEKQGKTFGATWLLGIAHMFLYYFAHGNTEGQKFHLLKEDSKIHLNL